MLYPKGAFVSRNTYVPSSKPSNLNSVPSALTIFLKRGILVETARDIDKQINIIKAIIMINIII